jgi:hypothetical protein
MKRDTAHTAVAVEGMMSNLTVTPAGDNHFGAPLAEVKVNGVHLTYANVVDGRLEFNGYFPRNLWGREAELNSLYEAAVLDAEEAMAEAWRLRAMGGVDPDHLGFGE